MSNKPSIWERRRAIELEVIKEKMLKANKAMAEKNDCVHTQLYKAQAELIDLWVEEEEKRPPPLAPLSPFGG